MPHSWQDSPRSPAHIITWSPQGFKKTMMEKGLMLLDVPDGPLLFDGETQTALGHQKIVSSWMAATLQWGLVLRNRQVLRQVLFLLSLTRAIKTAHVLCSSMGSLGSWLDDTHPYSCLPSHPITSGPAPSPWQNVCRCFCRTFSMPLPCP